MTPHLRDYYHHRYKALELREAELHDLRFSIRFTAAAGMAAAVTLAGQTVASAGVPGHATAARNVAVSPDGGPGHWSQVTTTSSNSAAVGLVRGTDGVLHILWEAGNINGRQKLMDTPVAPSGAVRPQTTIVSGQTFVGFPDATATSKGLHVFWGGERNLSAPSGIFEASRPLRGGKWTVGPIIPEGVLASPVTAATAGDDKPWLAFTSTDNLSLLHVGQHQDNVATKCCVYLPGIATNGVTGTSYVTYLSLISNAAGVWTRPLSKNGITGKAFRLPGSGVGSNTLSPDQRMAITGRGKGRNGVYVSYGAGYPFYKSLDVFRVGAGKPFVLATFGSSGSELAGSAITAGPDGKLWDTWIDGFGGPPAMFVRASNPTVSRWSKTTRVALPKGVTDLWNVYENAQGGKVDVVALMTVHGHIAYYATQVPLPPFPPKKTTVALMSAASRPAAAQSWRIAKSVPNTPRNGVFTALTATGKSTAWAFDSSGNSTAEPTAWMLRAGKWTRGPFPGRNDESVVNAAATSPTDVWAFTESFVAHTATGILSRVLHWNGHAWSVARTFPEIITEGAVTSPSDVWVFGEGQQNLAWYFNGHKWTSEGGDVAGGSVLGPNNAWGFTGTFVEHWPGHKWVATNVAGLLPKKTKTNDPQLTGVLALSSSNVYAFGQGLASNGCGPTVVLHFNGHAWKKVAQGSFGCGPITQMATSDGSGGLWLPMPDIDALPSFLVHYSNGKLTEAALPGGFHSYEIEGVAHFPGTTRELAGGFKHPVNNPNTGTAVILQDS